jgi:hypothetical protein
MLEYGKRILNFEREDQTCIIVIEPGRFGSSITITVAPRAGSATTYRPIQRSE